MLPTNEPELNNLILLQKARITVQDPDLQTDVESIDGEGVHLGPQKGLERVAQRRYVWMDLKLHGEKPLRALGQVVNVQTVQRRDPVTLALDIKFKHLFPDERRRLMRALGR